MDLSPSLVDSLDISPALSFMMIDLDDFKAINDNFGHLAGDQVLLQVRDVLQNSCRKSDTIIRWGGDEFLIVSRNTSNRAAEHLAERIRLGLAEHIYQLGGGNIARLSGSIGFAVYPFLPLNPALMTWEQVSTLADQCAYLSKQNGRNAWVGIYGKTGTTREDVAQLKNDMEGVLARGRIGLRTSIYGNVNFSDQTRVETI
jgi:diguanylate cyclase (GGDEF)-like protein